MDTNCKQCGKPINKPVTEIEILMPWKRKFPIGGWLCPKCYDKMKANTPKYTIEKCNSCNGTGRIKKYVCQACEGKGKYERINSPAPIDLFERGI